MNQTKQIKFRVAAISSNANAFGLYGHVLVDETGRAFSAGRSRGAHLKQLSHRDEVVLTETTHNNDGFVEKVIDWAGQNFEIPSRIADAPKPVVDDLFGPKLVSALVAPLDNPKGNISVKAAVVGHVANQGKRYDPVSFIMRCEDGTLTQEQFDEEAQKFVDSGVWKSLQGSWQRTVQQWAELGLITIK